MKKLLLLLFLSLTIIGSANAAVPSYITKDTFDNICRKAYCGRDLSDYYYKNYYLKKFHKAAAISYYKSGNRYSIDYAFFAWEFPTKPRAKSEALKGCRKEGRNCEIFLVNNSYDNEELYELLTTRYIPPNAYKSGNSWKCNYGYKKSGDRCIKKTVIPTNAHASGSSWACDTGYKKVGSKCNKIYVPKNASLSGSSWKCNYGYTKIGTSCQVVPANATVTSSGWECNTGFTKDGNSCNKVEESMDYIEELKKIKELLDSGVINEEEFKKMKQKVIDNM